MSPHKTLEPPATTRPLSPSYPFPQSQDSAAPASAASTSHYSPPDPTFGPEDENDATPTENTPLITRVGSPDDTFKGLMPYNNGLLIDITTTRFHVLFALILLVFFLSCFDATIMSSSHPVITSYFGSSNSASWMSTAFMLMQTTVQPLVGRFSDGTGRKIPFLLMTSAFALGTLGCALAPNLLCFVLSRALCGLGAGACIVLGTVVIGDIVPVRRRGAYQSAINANYGVSSSLGAAMGGWMADALGWRWEFGIQVPPLVLCVILMYFYIPDDLGREKRTDTVSDIARAFDWAGSFFLTITITSFVFFFSFGGNIYPWDHPFVVATGICFIIATVILVYIESCATHPVMPLWIITKAPHMNLAAANACAAVIINAIWFNIPLYFQAVVLTSATESGLNLVCPIIASCISGIYTGFAIQSTHRTKWPVMLGAVMLAVGVLLICTIHRGQSQLEYILYMLPAAFGQGFQFPGTFIAILNENSQQDQAVVTGSLILWRSFGQIIGIASSGLIVQNALRFFLDLKVQGPERDYIIKLVRKNVEAIAELKQPYLEQVIQSYEAALKTMFFTMFVIAVGSALLLWPAKLRRLGTLQEEELAREREADIAAESEEGWPQEV